MKKNERRKMKEEERRKKVKERRKKERKKENRKKKNLEPFEHLYTNLKVTIHSTILNYSYCTVNNIHIPEPISIYFLLTRNN